MVCPEFPHFSDKNQVVPTVGVRLDTDNIAMTPQTGLGCLQAAHTFLIQCKHLTSCLTPVSRFATVSAKLTRSELVVRMQIDRASQLTGFFSTSVFFSLADVFPDVATGSIEASKQGGIQAISLAVTLGIALLGGLIVGRCRTLLGGSGEALGYLDLF